MTRVPQKPAGSRGRGHGAKPEALREQAVVALLTERSITAAAKRVGINEQTLRGWLKEDVDFRTAYDAAKRAAYETAMSRVHALTARAVDTLEDLLAPDMNPSVRLGAARTIAEIAQHQSDADVILKRLDEIEAAQRLKESS